MKFQILKDGKVMFWTEDKSCIPSNSELAAMRKAGYKSKTINKEAKKAKEKNLQMTF